MCILIGAPSSVTETPFLCGMFLYIHNMPPKESNMHEITARYDVIRMSRRLSSDTTHFHDMKKDKHNMWR